MKKYNISVRMYLRTAAALCMAAVMSTSCTWDFNNINKDQDKATEEDLDKDFQWARYIQSMQLSVFAEHDNAYQTMDDLHGNSYSGYHGQANDWSGNNSLDYNFAGNSKNWHDDGFLVVYGALEKTKYPVPGIMNSWNTLRAKVDSSSVLFAVGEVMKVMGMHRATDMYGPLPYTQYGTSLYTEYDSQETIYRTFFKELDHAIPILTEYYNENPAAQPISAFDMLYGGDMLKWIKLANSLKLRLAMRISDVDETAAKKYAEEAVSHQHGVIESNSGTAMIVSNSIYPFTNPLKMIWEEYGEARMGATMDSYLKGYEDPRLPVYFSPSEYDGEYRGVRLSISDASSYKDYSTPNIEAGDPLYMLHAAEVYFLRAEGAVKGWDMDGSAGDLYEQGIRVSMEQHGIPTNEINTYLNSVKTPAKYDNPKKSSYSADALSSITVRWNDSAGRDEKIERIITQKWIAMYPNGQEAWSEFRRTGYPKVYPVVLNRNTAQVSTEIQIRRLPLPASEYINNYEITNRAVINHLNLVDSPGQRLWWDVE